MLSEALVSGLGTGVLAGAIYDAGRFRFGGSMGLLARENAATAFALGLQGYFVLHEAKNADFGIGGGFQLAYTDPGRGDAAVRFGITAGGQARLFVVDNAAITAGIGLDISLGKRGFEFLLGSALTGTFGLHYHF